MKSNYNVQVLVDGKPVKEYSKNGKTFVEAKFGTQYSVRLKNNTGKRVVAIVSIDGINAITGEKVTPESTGYVLNPYSGEEIKGYRQSTDGGARFKFTEKSTGYSKEIDGTGINSGVIGVLFVQEKEKPKPVQPLIIREVIREREPDPVWPRRWPDNRPILDWTYRPEEQPMYFRSFAGGDNSAGGVLRSMTKSVGYVQPTSSGVQNSANYCSVVGNAVDCETTTSFKLYDDSLKNKAPAFDAATTWGEKFEEKLSYVDFERSKNMEQIDIYYATRDSLKRMGIIDDSPPAVTFPQSFPGFAKPPANWKG